MKTPNPGSTAARLLGCVCPVIDNGHGRGFRGNPDVFVRMLACKVHAPTVVVVAPAVVVK